MSTEDERRMEKIALALNALPGGLHRPLRKIWEEGIEPRHRKGSGRYPIDTDFNDYEGRHVGPYKEEI